MNILTFDIGVTHIRYALCDEQFRLSDVHTVPTRAQQGGQHPNGDVYDADYKDVD